MRRFLVILTAPVALYSAFYMYWRTTRLAESTQDGQKPFIYVSFCDLNTTADFWTIPGFFIDSLVTGVSIICE